MPTLPKQHVCLPSWPVGMSAVLIIGLFKRDWKHYVPVPRQVPLVPDVRWVLCVLPGLPIPRCEFHCARACCRSCVGICLCVVHYLFLLLLCCLIYFVTERGGRSPGLPAHPVRLLPHWQRALGKCSVTSCHRSLCG